MEHLRRAITTSQKFLLIAAHSFIFLSACSTLQSRLPEHPPQPDHPSLPGNPSQPPSDENFARSVLDGSDRPGASPLDLIKNPQVKDELQLTEAQSAKIEQIEAKLKSQSQQLPNLNLTELNVDQREKQLVELSEQLQKQAQTSQKEVASILQPDQLKRLKEITLQLYGWGVLTSSQFIEELQVTPQQQQQFMDLHKQMLRQISENWPAASQDKPEAKQVEREVFRQTMDRITRQANQQALAILTPEQQKLLETLKGRKFELDPAQMPTTGPGTPGQTPGK